MERPSSTSLLVTEAPDMESMADSLRVAQTRARESERLVEEYDSRFSAAVRRIRDYVEEGWEQLLIAQHRVSTVERDISESHRLGSVDETRLSSMHSTVIQLRQQASILEMEFQRRKRLQTQLDLFHAPGHVSQSATPLVSPTPQASASVFTLDPPVTLRVPTPAPHPSLSTPTSPWPTPAITPRPSPSPSPGPASADHLEVEAIATDGESIGEMKRRVHAAEERARQAEEERALLELRLRSLVAALDEDSRSVGAMRALLQKGTDPSDALVLPAVDVRLQTLRNEANSALHGFVRWLLSFFVPSVLD
jgi:hypothetical protein